MATIDFLNQQVTNPFRGLVPGQGINGSITRGQPLKPFLQHRRHDERHGRHHHYRFRVKLEHRSSRAPLLVGYTGARFTERCRAQRHRRVHETRPAAADAAPSVSAIGSCRSARAALGRRPHLTNAIVGNWSAQAIGQFQAGRRLISQPITTAIRRAEDCHQDNTDLPCVDLTGFYFHDAQVQTNGVDDQ